MMQLSGRPVESSQKTRCGLMGSASFIARFSTSSHQSTNVFSIFFRHERSSLRWSSGMISRSVAGVADEIQFHREANADHPAVDVDLHRAGLIELGQELHVREAGADHQERVAFHHHLVAWIRPQQPDGAGDEWEVVGQDVLPQQRLGDAGASWSAISITSSAAPRAPCPTASRPLPSFSISAAAAAFRGTGTTARERRPDAARRILNSCGTSTAASSCTSVGKIRQVTVRSASRCASPGRRRRQLLRGGHHGHVLVGHVLEQRMQIDFLLVVAPQRGGRLLADDRHDRLVVESRVVQPVEQVDRLRARTWPCRRPPRR